MSEQGGGGYVLRGTDGSLYLIRDEVLEACKMSGEDLEFAQSKLGGEGTGQPFSEFSRVDYKDAPRWQKGGGGGAETQRMSDTIMCGW